MFSFIPWWQRLRQLLVLYVVVVVFLFVVVIEVSAFTPTTTTFTMESSITTSSSSSLTTTTTTTKPFAASSCHPTEYCQRTYHSSSSNTRLYNTSPNNNDNNNNGYSNNFDISRPTFDLYTLRSIRGDALLRYNSLNQSEPLRINIYLIVLATCFSYPVLSQAVLEQEPTLQGIALSILCGSFASYRFVRECTRRNNKLMKIEKECNALSLTIRLPSNLLKRNPFEDRPFAPAALSLETVLSTRYRIVAICGPIHLLQKTMVEVQAFRRRLVQAKVLVIPVVSTDAEDDLSSGFTTSSIKSLDMDIDTLLSVPFVAETVNTQEWVTYFQDLVGGQDDNDDDDSTINDAKVGKGKLVWFGLSSSGKSFGSGVGNPRWLEILGQSLLPQDVLDPDDPTTVNNNDEASQVLKAQSSFYEALTTGNEVGIRSIMATTESDQVSEVILGGGSLDDWKLCLRDGARPEGMVCADSDVFLVPNSNVAYTTTIEYPIVETDPSASLLAVQEWRKENKDGIENNHQEWKLVLHQTIPWGPDTRAGATLRCDCRGCTALAKTVETNQYNFRGMID